jgi:hypothetical protein
MAEVNMDIKVLTLDALKQRYLENAKEQMRCGAEGLVILQELVDRGVRFVGPGLDEDTDMVAISKELEAYSASLHAAA